MHNNLMNRDRFKKMRLLMSGHGGFHNRGCEAIVRSTMSLLGKAWPDIKYVLYSSNANGDKREISDNRVVIRDARTNRYTPRWLFWGIWKRKPQYIKPFVKLIGQQYLDVNVALSVGGDNYSLDYGSPKWLVDTDRLYMSAGIPVVIWGASIGPFGNDMDIRKLMIEHLKNVDLITARETNTVSYLKSLGVSKNVVRVFDPAFTLEGERYEGLEKRFMEAGDVIGFNISPLIMKWREDKSIEGLIAEMTGFVEYAISSGFKILMIPHVSACNKVNYSQGDDYILKKLETSVKMKTNNPDRVMLLRSNIPVRQIKWIISQCKYFIGARTHSTIAALSSGIPTITIAYSMKARGINRDIFGHENFVIETPSLSRNSLIDKMKYIIGHERDIRSVLRDKKIDMLKGAEQNVVALKEVLHAKSKSQHKNND